MKTSTKGSVRSDRDRGERGEVFPVAILFGGVIITILIGLHVVLLSIGQTAVRAAADRGVTAAQTAQIGAATCGTIGVGGHTVTPTSARECEGVIATLSVLNASGAMVHQTEPPSVSVNEAMGVVAVGAFGAVVSPIFGPIEIVGYACGPLDLVEGTAPSRADASAC